MSNGKNTKSSNSKEIGTVEPRSNLFRVVEDKFRFADKEYIKAVIFDSLRQIIDYFGIHNSETIFGIMILGTRLGLAGTETINIEEKELINEVFKIGWKGSMDEIYDMVSEEVSEEDYQAMQSIANVGNPVAMPFLDYTVGFAYYDGKINDKVAKRLDRIFGMNLLIDFIQSGQEEIPGPKVQLTDLEANIVRVLQTDDQLPLLKNIMDHFPDSSQSEIETALDSLVEKGLLAVVETGVGNIYELLEEIEFND